MEQQSKKQFDNHQFKQLRESLKLTQAEFAEKVGSTQQVINMIEKDKRGVPTSIREGFYKAFNIPYDLAVENKPLTQREVDILETLANTKKDAITSIFFNTNNVVKVKYYTDAKAAAGKGIDVPEVSDEHIMYFDKRWLENIVGVSSTNAIIIQAKGNSMDGGDNPIKDGDLLLVDVSVKDVINNKIFLIQQNSQLRVKRLKKELNGDLYLLSNNEKDYPPELVKQESAVIGRVVWNCSKENI